ncbi:DUF4268 domain-containing protein [Flavobacterium ardleyense]|uniref:DUF4268 domain-containing protein n=1 Tax=Flavobacterium ardleyense TaxID=2038737 RepID=UPI00298BE54F|nr:DUF4268 domain-containing protein [Flavobacterium ardleyense]
MYSREENQKLKREFWIAFAEKYPRKWVLYDTKIKDFSFKFYVDNKKVQVLIDIEHKSEDKRVLYFEKLESLKSIIHEEFVKDLVFEKEYHLETQKIVSRVWVEMSGVKVSNRSDWDRIFDFFYKNMDGLERFYLEYDDYIKDI